MSDEKLTILRQSHTLHPHPDQVRDPLFTSGSPFFDPRDLVQVKYELLRRVRVDGYSVASACSSFALSRPTFYAAKAAWEESGVAGLLASTDRTTPCSQADRGDSQRNPPKSLNDVFCPIGRVAPGAVPALGPPTQY